MGDGLSIRVDIQDNNVILDRDGGWDLRFHFDLISASLVLDSTAFA